MQTHQGISLHAVLCSVLALQHVISSRSSVENEVLICWKSTTKWLTSRFPNPGKGHIVHILSDLLLTEGEMRRVKFLQHAYVCAQMCVGKHAHICGVKRLMSWVLLYCSPCLSLSELSCSSRVARQRTQWPLLLSQVGLQGLYVCAGDQTQVPMLHDNHLTNWAIPLLSLLFFLSRFPPRPSQLRVENKLFLPFLLILLPSASWWLNKPLCLLLFRNILHTASEPQ